MLYRHLEGDRIILDSKCEGTLILKNSNEYPLYDAKSILCKIQEFAEAQLLFSAINLDVFSNMENQITAFDLAKKTNYNQENLELLLNALVAVGYISKENENYQNLPKTNLYLNKKSKYYLGDSVIFWSNEKNLEGIESLVKNGPTHSSFNAESGKDAFDFTQMAKAASAQMYTGRVQSFIAVMEKILDKQKEIEVMDLGGGCGILAIELAKNFSNVSATVFDQSEVIELAKQTIEKHNVTNQVKTLQGDFIEDDFGKGYGLLIASGIFDFVGDINRMAKKLYEALTPDGLLYVDTHNVNDDFTYPKECIIGWLKSRMDGLDILQNDTSIKKALINAGFIEKTDLGIESNCYVFEK